MKKLIFAVLSLAFAVGLGQHHFVQAASGNDFEVQPVLPDNQTDQTENFYDLKVTKSSQQTLQLRIQNFTNKTITVKSDIRNAYTQIGGGIDFDAKTFDSSMKYPLTTLLKLPKAQQTITLSAHEATTLTAELKIPSTGIQGMVYGDWHFSEKVAAKSKTHTAVNAHYAYSVGVCLQGKGYHEASAALTYEHTRPFLYNKHPAMAITVKNTQPMAMRQVAITGEIAQVGKADTKRRFTNSSVMIAPSSTLQVPISWNYDSMKPGKYQIKLRVKGQNYANRFPIDKTFVKSFTVARSTTNDLNQRAAKKPKNQWIPVTVGLGVLWLLAVGSLIWLLAVRPR